MAERSTDERLLSLLLDAGGDYVAGQKLQGVLGVSRPAIHQGVERLGNLGIVIEGRRHYGYRLVEEPAVFTEILLRAYRPLVLGCPEIHFLDTVASTNSVAERLLAEGRPTPFVVLAREQTAGRGRRGRVWHSPSEGNLYASFAFRPQRPPHEMPPITLWLGVAVAACLRERLQLPVMVKWPNDLLVGGRKLAGMLTEARIDADALRDLVFGLGLNLQADTGKWPEEVRAVATSVAAHLPDGVLHPSWHRLTVELLAAVVRAYDQFIAEPTSEELCRRWPEFDALAGKSVQITGPDGPLVGAAAGIDELGRLQLRLPDGTLRPLSAGEVTLGSGPRSNP